MVQEINCVIVNGYCTTAKIETKHDDQRSTSYEIKIMQDQSLAQERGSLKIRKDEGLKCPSKNINSKYIDCWLQ
jgi:hypothetical protein